MIGNNNIRKIFMALPLPVIILEPREHFCVILDVNEAYLNITGSSQKDLLGKTNFEAFPKNPDIDDADFKRLQESFEQVVRERKPFSIERLRYDIPIRGTGEFEERYWNAENTPIFDSEGKVELIIHTVRDITREILEKKGFLEDFKRKEQLNNFIEENIDALFSLDLEGRFTNANERLAEAAEMPLSELMGNSFGPLCAPHDLEKVNHHFKRALAGEATKYEANFITVKGKPMTLQIALLPVMADGKVTEVSGIAKDITGLREREEQIRKNEQKFQALIQEGTDLMAITDIKGHFLYISETSTSVLGFPPETLVGKHVFEFIHPEDRERVSGQFSELKEKKQVKISPCRYKTSTGTWLWVETTATNLLKDPAVKGIVINSRNITTILEQAHEIEQINERYRLAASATEDLIYDWDLEKDQVKRFYSGPKKLFGYTEEEVNARTFWRSHIHPDQLEALRTNLKDTLNDPDKTAITNEYLFQRADGTYAKVIDKASIIRDVNGKALRLIGATTDISEIKAKEDELKRANERFRMAMEATNEMIWDWDIENDSIVRSQAFKNIYGYSLDAAYPPNKFWFSRTLEEDRDRVSESLDRALNDKDQEKWQEEYQVRKADNTVAHVIDRAFILRNKDGRATRMVGAVLDVTQSRRLLREVQKQNTLLKEIAWEQSHVVRAPLARLKGLIYLLEIKAFNEMDREEIIDNINKSADELDTIVRRIVSRTQEITEDPKF